ncbi:MAG: AMP-dependent synthetase [Bacteroidetes bacterium GWC2_33_15]|nr:MAG: AMP-dependent synthetase [Bacteroidetes bacterium GWA2_33_15]OFX50377.1 MAG: AMP-dependent synthetase [Bacteroidetes bacterium GWC2_33_15]OFX66705.1 MAG: AMP-dependent synthetase [Bacteroidetes bacterium GWB2_32_14]OFX69323.1 MAG: AMP-dependent synthetase [Bacteroidetes bacterium GWD2_33_33]HAN18640.1 AMP-dependent synthetase [Bacteroidales bacterium]
MTKLKNQTIPALLENSFQLYGNNTALTYVNGNPLTYTDLKAEIEKMQVLLASFNIQKGDKVAILSRNMPNWGIAYFAITSMGAIAVPMLPDFHENEIQNIIEHSESKAIIVSKLMYPKIEKLKQDLLDTIIYSDDLTIERGTQHDMILKDSPNYIVQESDVASIIYTSGTTGKSKGVMLTHKNIVNNAIQVLSIEPVNSTHKFLSILPLSHTYENTLGFVLPLMQGASVYYLEKPPTAAVLLPALKIVRPTHILSVPMVIEKIYRNQILPKFTNGKVISALYKVGFIRKILNRLAGKKLYGTFGGELVFFGVGGAPLDPTVEKFLREAKFPYAIGYGLTESSPLLSGANPHQVKLRATGPVLKGVQIKINNPDSVTGEGEVWAKGDNIMKGYYKEPQITSEVLTPDGWLKTGDLGYFDKDNYLFIRGRIKNMIVGASGENIYPEEIESVINNFKYVVESVVVEQKGKLVALVHFNHEELEKQFNEFKEEAMHYIKEKIDELSIELQEYVNSRVNKFSRVYAVVSYSTPFEKTATHKIKRYLYY